VARGRELAVATDAQDNSRVVLGSFALADLDHDKAPLALSLLTFDPYVLTISENVRKHSLSVLFSVTLYPLPTNSNLIELFIII